MSELPLLSDLTASLEYLLTNGNSPEAAVEKSTVIEEIADRIAYQLRAQKLTSLCSKELERLAYDVNSHIKDPDVRNMHILTAV